MTRIVYWNVQQFSATNMAFQVRTNKRRRFGGFTIKDVTASRALLLRHFGPALGGAGTGADIVVVVEVSSGPTGLNQMISRAGGWNGLRAILVHLRATDPVSGWNLVPPFSVGLNTLTEGVGIFYKSIIVDPAGGANGARYFTGPNKFTPGTGLSFDPGAPGAPVAGNYPAPGVFNTNIGFFHAPRNIPVGSAYNPSVGIAASEEQQCAPRVVFQSMANPLVNVVWGNPRQPFMATFYEAPPAGGAARDLTLFAVHSPSSHVWARGHVNLFADCQPIADNNHLAETKVVLGDFNINLFRADGTQTTGYNPLTAGAVPVGNVAMPGGNYTLQISRDPLVDQTQHVYKGYYATHMKNDLDARFRSTLADTYYYPGYGYQNLSIDNVLVRAPGGGAGGAVTSILNSVDGAPMNAPAWSRPVPPAAASPAPPMAVAGVPWNSSMAVAPLNGGNPNNAAPTGNYRTGLSWNDYGHIYSTSDHIALVTDL